MTETNLEKLLVSHVKSPDYRPVKPRKLFSQLHITDETEAKNVLKRLIKSGILIYGPKHLVQAGDSNSISSKGILGVFQRTSKGFGFVRPLKPISEEREKNDIYIPAKRAADASTGDTVLVRLSKLRSNFPGRRGEIIQIIERQTHQFVGTYFELRGQGYVQVDGSVFSQAINVGDPGAKNVHSDDKVVFEMIRFPSPTREGEGVITEVLGPRGKPGVDTLSIIREYNLPDQFPEDVLAEVRHVAEQFSEDELRDRLDLTREVVLTIDPADARDFDDAISLTKTEEGNWRLGVHIADVSHFVQPNTAVDREAQKRSTSVYLPDRVLPMLPEIISNSLASLQPDRIRWTKSVFIEYDPEGVKLHSEFYVSAIRSSKRLNYEEVDHFIADPSYGPQHWDQPIVELLTRMRELAALLRKRRFAKGALEMSMPEVKIDLDKEGKVAGAHVVENTESHQIIEDFMLAANEAVAEAIDAKGWLFLRRIHASPSPRKLKALTEFVQALGYKTGSLENRFALQKLLREVHGRPEEHAVNFAALRSMQRAIYGIEEEGHYALAIENYCHFTSPIRRYPDLTIHRLLDALIHKEKPAFDEESLFILGRHCSDREQRAEDAERELTKLKLLTYLSNHLGLEMDGVITGVESFGLFVQGIELPAEGLLRVDALQDDYYRFDRAAHILEGHRKGNSFRLGDKIRVAVNRVDLERRELDFRLAEKKARKAPARKKPKGK